MSAQRVRERYGGDAAPTSPRFAYLPDLKGDVLLSDQFSKENYDAGHPTDALCALTPGGFFSTAFVGGTSVGKTVAAEWLVLGRR